MRKLFILGLLLSNVLLFAQSADRAPLSAAGAEWTTELDHHFSLTVPGQRAYGSDPKTAAAAFLGLYRDALGAPAATTFRFHRSGIAADGRTYVHFTLEKQGYPVLGREVTVVTDGSGRVYGLSGTPLSVPFSAPAAAPPSPRPYPSGFTTPELSTRYPFFHQWNAAFVGREWVSADPWDAGADYQLTDVYDVTEPGSFQGVRVYLDAVSGKLVFEHQLHCTLDRELYHRTVTNPVVWEEGDAFPGSLDAEDQEMVTATGEIYNLYRYTFGRNGLDDNDRTMIGITRRTGGCPNASANGDNIVNHCPGLVTDDIVGHEWSHNYVSYMSNLIYRYESGALDEAYADIFGETIDLLNARGEDAGDATLRTNCGSGLRWMLGEGSSIGSLRDMYSPECESDPGARNSTEYECYGADFDNGGVHIHSGIPNRVYSLLVDGGTLNGVTVSPIGMTKALHLFQHAQANYMTRTTNFQSWGAMLEQSVTDLTGVDLTALTLGATNPGPSGEVITAADLTPVQNALMATQVSQPNACPITPNLAQDPPAPCAATEVFTPVFTHDWAAGTAGWTLTEAPVNPGTWDPKPWATTAVLPDGRAGTAIFAPNPVIGDCNGDFDNGSADLTSPAITLPATADNLQLRFDHYFATETNWDGGVLYLSRNGGGFTPIGSDAFLYNGYSLTMRTAGQGNDNPAAGLDAFSGSNDGDNGGSWGTSIVDLLAAGAVAGDQIQLRWSMTHDGCNGLLGWYLQDVSVGSCALTLPVTYTALSATPAKDHVTVAWATATEEANRGFHVERRAAGETDFLTLGFVAAGTDYAFNDYRAAGGVTYHYRLRQEDLDGTMHLSDVVTATLDGGRPLSVYPNPNRGSFTVLGGGTDVRVYDLSGRMVRSFTSSTAEISGLRPGVYVVRAGEEVLRVVVQ